MASHPNILFVLAAVVGGALGMLNVVLRRRSYRSKLNVISATALRDGQQPRGTLVDAAGKPLPLPELQSVAELKQAGIDEACRRFDPQFDSHPEAVKAAIRKAVRSAEDSGAQKISIGIRVHSGNLRDGGSS